MIDKQFWDWERWSNFVHFRTLKKRAMPNSVAMLWYGSFVWMSGSVQIAILYGGAFRSAALRANAPRQKWAIVDSCAYRVFDSR